MKSLGLCLNEPMKQRKIKPTDYHKLATIDQGPSENLTVFLKTLREALIKHTNVDPDSTKRELMLKDQFFTQSTSDIRRKLKKLALGPNTWLGKLLNITTLVFYNWDQEKLEKAREGEGVEGEHSMKTLKFSSLTSL